MALCHCVTQRTARFFTVHAIAEAAVAQKGVELHEAVGHLLLAEVTKAKFANPRRVDQVAAFREVIQACSGCCVGSFACVFRQCTNANVLTGQQRVNQ